jgi:hypothetical protein
VAGSDMTVEAALTKLSYVLGRDDWNFEEKCKVENMNVVIFAISKFRQ